MSALVEIELRGTRKQFDRWRSAARAEGLSLSLEKWICEIFDRVAAAYEADEAPYGRCRTCAEQLPPPKLTGRPRQCCPGSRGDNYCRKGRRPPT